MANVFVEESTMTAIGDAIRAKTGGSDRILPADMPIKIAEISISDGGNVVSSSGLVVVSVDTPIYRGASTIWTRYQTVPADAVNIYAFRAETYVNAYDSSYQLISENYATLAARATNPTEMTETVLGDGYKKVKIFSETIPAVDGAKLYVAQQVSSSIYESCKVIYTMPNISIENNILYANEECEGIWNDWIYNGRNIPYYLEGVDLRGSKIQKLLNAAFSHITELKKVWLSESMSYLSEYCFYKCSGLEEFHFTSETPPTVASSTTFQELPTTCKIYIPTGTLDAYTSATNYPSASTYTYIEE